MWSFHLDHVATGQFIFKHSPEGQSSEMLQKVLGPLLFQTSNLKDDKLGKIKNKQTKKVRGLSYEKSWGPNMANETPDSDNELEIAC